MLESVWLFATLIVCGFLPTEVWRLAGVVIGRRLNEGSSAFVFIKAISTSLIAVVIVQLMLWPPGHLASLPWLLRLAAMGVAYLTYLSSGTSAAWGVLAGASVLVIGGALNH